MGHYRLIYVLLQAGMHSSTPPQVAAKKLAKILQAQQACASPGEFAP